MFVMTGVCSVEGGGFLLDGVAFSFALPLPDSTGGTCFVRMLVHLAMQ
jgi:hypothetical protein